MSQTPGRPALFLDRDGTIIEDVDYLSGPEQIRLIPGAAGAIAEANRVGMKVIVVTNQSGVARGRFPESQVAVVHARLSELLHDEGAQIDGYYYCPHLPTADVASYRQECQCRKPRPGMLVTAAHEHGLDLSQSWMIGDKLSDLEAGAAVGCRTILVRTGHGAKQQRSTPDDVLHLIAVVDHLADAVNIAMTSISGVTCSRK